MEKVRKVKISGSEIADKANTLVDELSTCSNTEQVIQYLIDRTGLRYVETQKDIFSANYILDVVDEEIFCFFVLQYGVNYNVI